MATTATAAKTGTAPATATTAAAMVAFGKSLVFVEVSYALTFTEAL